MSELGEEFREFRGLVTARLDELCRCVKEIKTDVTNLHGRVTGVMVANATLRTRVKAMWAAAGALATICAGLALNVLLKG